MSILNELRKKKPEDNSHLATPADRAYDDLQSIKGNCQGKFPAGSLQLFVPRGHPGSMSKRDKRLDNLGNKYAYDDKGKLKPEYEKWENMAEAAPILYTGRSPGIGNNKPNSILWTSTAKKMPDGSYTSDWVRYVHESGLTDINAVGYLYKVAGNANTLRLDHTGDAERIYRIFQSMDRGAQAEFDPQNRDIGGTYYLQKDFPWDEIAKHFDGVYHNNSSIGGYGYDSIPFTYGWDCESTAWFNPSVLTLLGEVKITAPSEEDQTEHWTEDIVKDKLGFIKELTEAKTFYNHSTLKGKSAEFLAELIQVMILGLEIIRHEHEKYAVEYATACMRYSDFTDMHLNSPDLYNLIVVITNQLEYSDDIVGNSSINVPVFQLKRYFRDIMGNRNDALADRSLFYKLEKYLKISDTYLKTVRRIVSDWHTVGESDRADAKRLLLNKFRSKANYTDIGVYFRNM